MIDHPAYSREFSQWIRAARPDQWHQAAQSWNFDNAMHWLKWMVEQPTCDLGTALYLFWLSDPAHNLTELNPYRKVRQNDGVGVDKETLELQITVLMRWVRGSFTRSEIAFDGYRQIAIVRNAEIAPIVPLEVLEAMAQPRRGKTIDRGEFNEGIPFHIERAFYKANGIEPA